MRGILFKSFVLLVVPVGIIAREKINWNSRSSDSYGVDFTESLAFFLKINSRKLETLTE